MPSAPVTIVDYAGLQATMLEWALPGGAQPEFEAQIPNFIRLAEVRFDAQIRCHHQVGTSNVTTDNALIEVPGDWLETITFSIPGRGALDPLTLAQEADWRGKTPGTPACFTMMDGGIRPLPPPSGMITYELVYYRMLDKLTDLNTTNWLLRRYPDLYLFASLVAAEAFLRNTEDLPLWAQSVQNGIDELNEKSKGAEFARGKPIARVITIE